MGKPEATARYRALRRRHRIIAVTGGEVGVQVCDADGVRVYRIKNGTLRHDRGGIGVLASQASLTPAEDTRLRRHA